MPRTDTDQVFDQNGTLLSSTTVIRPLPLIDPATYQQARATLKSMVQTFAPGGIPTGTPTAVQMRNWLLALTVGEHYLLNASDTD